MKEKIQKFRQYLDYIERHYDNVQKAWELIKKECQGKGFKFLDDDYTFHAISQDVINHDNSKLSKEEFTQYRAKFFPMDGEVAPKEDFINAWEHHKKNNFHHWQHWTKLADLHPMGEIYLVSMVVDWVAMGYEFNDTAKSYYEKNKGKIKLPPWAIELMYEIFDCIYP